MDDEEKFDKKETGDQHNKNADALKPMSTNKQEKSSNSGWFGGIWNKLALRPKNQMKLPDDKNPTV